MAGISTHVLDTARGRPAAGIAVRLESRLAGSEWEPVADAVTDADGRALLVSERAEAAVYRLRFDTGPYLGDDHFFPEVTVVFRTSEDDRLYHVPLLLSPFGYSTYRGS
jgi:5-hydroxyisourate hydrolase